MQYFKWNIKEADVSYSSVYINNEYNQYFHSRDYEVLINLSKEAVELDIKEEDKDDLECIINNLQVRIVSFLQLPFGSHSTLTMS